MVVYTLLYIYKGKQTQELNLVSINIKTTLIIKKQKVKV